MKTWHVEMLVVASVLYSVAFLRGGGLELLGASAVLASFGHMQVSDRMAEQQHILETASVECYKKAYWYLISKESLWIFYFIALKSYAGLLGCGIFLIYPVWRRWWRRRHPV